MRRASLNRSERTLIRSVSEGKYTTPDTGEVRTVTVPLHDRVTIGTLQWIAD
jgi:hypothetical protein